MITVNDKINDYEDYEGDEKNTTISNVLTGDSVINEKANHGTVTLDNEDSNDYVKLWAQEGDIAIANREAANAETVQIGAGREVSVSSLEAISGNGSLTVTELLLAEGSEGSYSKVDANLQLSPNAELDVSAAGGKGGLDLTDGELTISMGATLSSNDIARIYNMEIGEMYDLAFNVAKFNGTTENSGFNDDGSMFGHPTDASVLFGDDQFWKGEYYVCYSGSDNGGNGSNVGTVYLYKATPEPTTGTLSLLALAALAARRRRKG